MKWDPEKQRENLRKKILQWQQSPERCAREAFGLALDDQQKQLIQTAVFGKCPRTAVKSGQKTGKTNALAFLAWYQLLTVANAQVYITASSADVIRDGVWQEMRRMHAASTASFVRSQIPEMPSQPGTGFELAGFRRCVGIATDTPERLQGRSGAGQLWILDEASGLKEELWPAILGNLAGGGKLVAASNPTKLSGYYRDIFAGSKAEFWNTLTLRSDQTSNYLQGSAIVPGLATRNHVDALRAEFGESSVAYQVRVLGEFPTQGADAIVTLDAAYLATERWATTPEEGLLHIGVDPARRGDDESVVTCVRGKRAVRQYFFQGLEGDQLAAQVLDIASRHKHPGEIPWVRIDENGIGSSPYDFLKTEPGLLVSRIMSGESAQDPRYLNKRAELWFGVREWLKAGGAIPDDDRLVAELVAATYSFHGSKIKVLDKDSMRKMLRRSPDRADALALAVYPLKAPALDLSFLAFSSGRSFGDRD